jgi:hypothetical protein
VDRLIKTFLRYARERPSLFGLDGSFGEYVAFLNGLDMGAGGRVLEGFGEWVARRVDRDGFEPVWPLLVLREADVEESGDAWSWPSWHGLAAEDEARAVMTLFELLGEFAQRGQRFHGFGP